MTDPSDDFKFSAQRWQSPDVVFVIDGSGGMDRALQTGNALVGSVNTARQVKKRLKTGTQAFYFGGPNPVALPLDTDEDPMRFWPQGPSKLMPTLRAIAQQYEARTGGNGLHILIVSDGIINDLDRASEEYKELRDFAARNPNVCIDVLITARQAEDTPLAEMVGSLPLSFKPKNMLATDEAALCRSINELIDTRHARWFRAQEMLRECHEGISHDIKPLRAMRFKTPEKT